MKKFLAFALILSLLAVFACKKSEQQTQQPTPAKPQETFKPQKGKKGNKAKQAQTPAPDSLEVYNEKNLVKAIPVAEFPTLTTTKIKVNNKDTDAVSLKDFLAKYNVKGKNVVVMGDGKTTNLTWEQATASDMYLILTKSKRLKVYTDSKEMADIKMPKRLDKITVSATVEAAANPKEGKEGKEGKGKTSKTTTK